MFLLFANKTKSSHFLKPLTILIATCLTFLVNAQTTDLIISEYIEGSSSNKYIEIYNGTGAAVDLSDYALRLYSNGAGAPSTTSALTGTLADGAVIVYKNSAATIYAGAATNLGAVNFNGDDAIELFNTTTATSIDVVGNIGCDPGASWSSGSHSTVNKTIVRNANVCSGALDTGNSPCDFPTLTTEWAVFNEDDISNLGSHTNTCVVSTNTITPGAVTGANFTVECATDDNGSIAFTATGTFTAGNVFTAQLSDATGSFASPTDIGTLSAAGVDPSGSISITIPAATASGANYVIRIVSSAPFVTSASSSSTFTITLTDGPCVFIPPHLTGVIINSCDGSCSEGDNELVFGNTGDYSLEVTASNFNFFYGSGSPAGTNYTDVLTTNAATTTAINGAAGCPGTFIEGTGATMPPNSSFILASDALCIDALTWSGLCGSGPIYIIYQNDANWNNAGNFANATTAGLRYFRSTFTTTDGLTHTIDYEYDKTQNSGTDGDFVTYNSSGGAPLTYSDDDCIILPTVLPIELLHFEAKKNGNTSVLTWSSASERASDYIEILRIDPYGEYESIGTVAAAGQSNHIIHYSFIDENPVIGENYYRLKLVDQNGSFDFSSTRVVVHDASNISITAMPNGNFQLNQQVAYGEFQIYSASGQLIENGHINQTNLIESKKLSNGMYILHFYSNDQEVTMKFVR